MLITTWRETDYQSIPLSSDGWLDQVAIVSRERAWSS